MTTPSDLSRIATAMGYTATTEDAGYGVTRVVLDRPCAGSVVFNPVENGAQTMEVIAWLCRAEDGYDSFAPDFYRWYLRSRGNNFNHDGSAKGICQAVTKAAARALECLS